jgi:CheY-like chemotaxis protein
MSEWRILVVDDEPLNLEIIGEYLEDGPYHLEMAGNGADAWEILEHSAIPFDLVILDRMMPIMDGMELLRRIKATSRHESIPVIMQTAASTPEQIREGLSAGCYYYLTKPYKPAALLGIVHAALDELRNKGLLVDAAMTPPPIPATAGAEYTFSTLDEANRLTSLLATLCPDPAIAAMGLAELLVNAIEHGNLGISYAEKSRLKLEDIWEDEVIKRLQLPENRAKKATASFTRTQDALVFCITDQGNGFDWQKYLEFDPERAFDPNGRGIAMAGKIAFSKLEYQGNGNRVIATVQLQ